MKGKKALILASTLLFLTPGILGSREPSVPVAIDPELFHSVILPKEAKAEPLPKILEPHKPTHPSSRPEVKVAQATTKVIIKATPAPRFVSTGHSVKGDASWYCRAGRSPCHYKYPDTAGADYYAAAGPALRIAFGGIESSKAYQGKLVTVCGNKCVRVRLVDWCQCYYKTSKERVIDLYKDVWDAVDGGGYVTITW